jgi:uncharacterized membrane protein (GlpM family)
MSATEEEHATSERLEERPSIDLRRARRADRHGVVVRFIAGALISVVAGGVALAFGPRIGGIFLAFPAVLVASLTLIEKEEDRAAAREDARGATAGALALVIFAIVFTLVSDDTGGGIALLVATISWTVAALALYVVFWWR